MAKHLVICSICNIQFDTNEEEYVKTSARRYAHKKCAELQEQKQGIILRIHNKMKGILGETYNKTKIDRSIKTMVKEGKTEIGILNTLEYWYDIKGHGPEKANGGIGIVEWVYGDAMNYYEKQKRYNEIRETTRIEDYIDDEKTYYIRPKPIKKPIGVKLFNLR